MTNELWVRYLSGETLSEAEQKALVAALEADPELRASLLEDLQVDGALRAIGDARRSGDAFAASVVDCVGPERDATRFIRKVEARLADLLPPEPAGTSRDSRTNLPRISRRFHRREEPGGGWRAAVAAACALFALLLLSTAFSSKPARLPKPSAALKEAPLPEPERTAPERETVKAEKLVPLPPPKRAVQPEEPEFRDPQPLEVPPPKAPDATAAMGPPPPPAAAPAPAPTRSAAEAAIARGPIVLSVVDQVYYEKGQARVQAGARLDYDQNVYTVNRGRIVLGYDDDTTVAVGPDSLFRDLSGSAGRHLYVSVGELSSDIKPQPAGQPMVFETPHAKALILGTRIVLTAGKDAGVGTTLDVVEGKVRFQRNSDKAATDVVAGQSATASATTRELRPRISFPLDFKVRFAPADAPKASGVYLDSGLPFSASRGYGWDGARDGQFVPNAKQPDGSPVVMGRQAVWKVDQVNPQPKEDLKSGTIAAGWGEHAETWKIELPNGRYQVSVCVGDFTFEQGPHHVWVEGKQIVNRAMTKLPRQAHAVFTDEVEVVDGELNMKVGGYTTPQKSVDTSKDTLINYLVIKRVPAK